jgi:hypothetical protein
VPTALPSQLQNRRIVLGANPAANAEASDSPPAGKWWEVISYSIVNVQGGAGSSLPSLVLDDALGNVFYQAYGAAAAQSISTTQRYTWGRELQLQVAGSTPNIFAIAPFASDMFVPPGGHVRTVTVGLSANTDYGQPVISVIEYG